jgi:hypothetical protein
MVRVAVVDWYTGGLSLKGLGMSRDVYAVMSCVGRKVMDLLSFTRCGAEKKSREPFRVA